MKFLFASQLILLLQVKAFSQDTTMLKWWDPAVATPSALGGKGWKGQGGLYYSRLPEAAKDKVRKEVYELSLNSAGLVINFQTNSSMLLVEYAVNSGQQFPHMPATGVSGIDLYQQNAQRSWVRATAKYAFGDTVRFQYMPLTNSQDAANTAYRLYLPLYNSIKWLRIGIEPGAQIQSSAESIDRPVVVYGTSIAQGACASRPGMAWTSILGRTLKVPVVNLGFSGNGKLEPEVISFINEVEASVFILDCLPNLVDQSASEVKRRTISAVESIRSKHPNTPILLTEHLGYGDEHTNAGHAGLSRKVNDGMQEAYSYLHKQGIKEIYVLTRKEIGMNEESFVDQIHPNDIGMLQYAMAYAKKLAQIMHR